MAKTSPVAKSSNIQMESEYRTIPVWYSDDCYYIAIQMHLNSNSGQEKVEQYLGVRNSDPLCTCFLCIVQ